MRGKIATRYNTPSGSLPNQHIAIDAPITQALTQALGKRLAAAERAPGHGNDGHDS
jgi:hypothetical protein